MEIAENGPRNIQVLTTPPVNDGGLIITSYLFEFDVVTSFDSANYGNVTVASPSSGLQYLYQNYSGPIVFELSNLVSGMGYFVRVSAANGLGYGLTTLSTTSATPAAKPQPPSQVVLSYDTAQSLITSVNVTWSAPTGTLANGGLPITGYLVEWWQPGTVFDVQLVRWTSTFFLSRPNGSFFLSFGPEPGLKFSTSIMPFDINEWNLRSELMNLNYTPNVVLRSEYPIPVGNLVVNQQQIINEGYQWSVTFASAINQGNQVLLTGAPGVSGLGETVTVQKLVNGIRNGGNHEIQLLTIYSVGSVQVSDLGGWFRLSFEAFNSTNTETQYINVNSSASDLQRELNQLSTLRFVSVTKSEVLSSGPTLLAGYQWQITFVGNVGNQPKLVLDSSLVYTSQQYFEAFVDDGDNSLASDGTKASYAVVGEPPLGYDSAVVGADSRSFLITQLTPGEEYFIRVSAINALGIGNASSASSLSTTPPVVLPEPPTNVSIAVDRGSTSLLDVTYFPPASDGGAPILFYRVELDTTLNFYNPIVTIIPCPVANLHTVYQVTTSGNASNLITGGFFQLIVSFNGITQSTDYISYDSTAMMADEEGIVVLIPGVTAPSLLNNSFSFTANIDVTNYVFVNDSLVFSTQLYSADSYRVINVATSVVTVDHAIVTGTTGTATVSRFYGGRGINVDSHIMCVSESDYSYCPLSRRQNSGSMQSKLQALPDLFTLGVTVERQQPDLYNGYTWLITFLDSAPNNGQGYSLAAASPTLEGGVGSIKVTQLVAGTIYASCTGTQVVPTDAYLVEGQYYFARVFAVNQVGYSLPQVSLSSQKPMVVPGPPTSVVLSVVSSTELRVIFNPPVSDGGDSITSYLIEYSTAADFSTFMTTYVTYLSGGAPFFKTITGLVPGVYVYVRVSAGNSQGYGPFQTSTPASLNPYQTSDAPTNTLLRVTSSTMLTVSFALPLNNGGDTISLFRVEWDTVPGFNGVQQYPNKGYVDVDAVTYSSYTIQYLTSGQLYYTRVFAINSGGPGVAALTSPTSAIPSPQVPGKPQTLVVLPGAVVGSISVSWQRPTIPWHGIPCSGTPLSPNACPPMIPGGLPASDGGLSISQYAVSYNDLPDFSGLDSNNGTGFTTTSLSYTLTGLTPGKLYYVRVLARNSQGSGPYCSYVEPNCLIVNTRAMAVADL